MIPDNEPIWQHGRRAGRHEATPVRGYPAVRPALLVGEAAMLTVRLSERAFDWSADRVARDRALRCWHRAARRYRRRVAAATGVGGSRIADKEGGE